jgi:hypothetical protein
MPPFISLKGTAGDASYVLPNCCQVVITIGLRTHFIIIYMENSINIAQLRASPLRIKFETRVGFATSFIVDRAQTSVLLTNGHGTKRTLP